MRQHTPLTWLARILLALQLLWLPHAAMAAAYATGGSGKYKNDVLWLTWGDAANSLGKKNVALGVGAKTTASLAVADGMQMDVSCTITSISGGTLSSYAPGGWKGSNAREGDRLDVLYNIGGEGGKNQLVSGILSQDGKDVDFKVRCESKINGKDLSLRGFVIADAESMNSIENIRSSGEGRWYLIDRYVGANAGNYRITRSNNATGINNIRIDSGAGNGGRTAVTFLKFSDPKSVQTMDFGVKGQGKTAVAIGLVIPLADFGDAPESYGEAMHLIDDINFTDDGIGTSGAPVDINNTSVQLAQFLASPSDYLGTSGPDGEPKQAYSANGKGDDSSGALAAMGKEEDAWPVKFSSLSVLQAGQALPNIPIICKGTGTVAAWLDLNSNGQFDSSEKSSASCVNGQAQLNWTLPKDLKAGKTFVRLRYSSQLSALEPTGVAEDGEVEDHMIVIESPKLSIAKQANSPAWTIAQADAKYTLTVTNSGKVATGPSVNEAPVKVLDLLPNGLTPKWNGVLQTNNWSCSYSGQLISCILNSGTYISADSGVSQIEIPVNVLPAAANTTSLTNYASVGGGHDPENKGEPPSPGACQQAGYCTSADVVVKGPSVIVNKQASPVSQTSVKVNDVITYTLEVSVQDSATLSPVVLSDSLGAGLEYAGISSNPNGFVEGGSGSKRSFTLAAGAKPGSYLVSYKAKVTADAVSKVENHVVPAGGGDPSHSDAPPPSCSSCATSHPLAKPQVEVSKSSNPAVGATVKAGQTVTYTLTAVVKDSQTNSPVVLNDALGPDLQFGVVVGNTGFVPGGAGNARVFTLPAGAVPGTYTVSYTVKVKDNATQSSNLGNVVTIGDPNSGISPDPLPTCTTCSTSHVLSAPKVEYSKTTTAVKAQEGDEIEYQVAVKVSDAQTTAPVVLTDTLGKGLVYVGGSASGDLTETGVTGQQVQFTLATNSAPGTYKLKYRVKVTADADDNSPLSNVVLASGGGGTPACLAGASCQTSTPLVVSAVRYSKSVAAPSSPVKMGDVLDFTLQVQVTGAKTLGEVVLQDTLGAGLAFEALFDGSNAGWTAGAAAQVLTIRVPQGLATGTYTYRYKAKVTADASGSVKNAVLGSGYDNPSCSINCATETPVAKPAVSFTKTSVIKSAKIGDIIAYTLTVEVKNASLGEAVSSVVDNVSQGLELVAVKSAPGYTYSINGQSLLLTLPVGTKPGSYPVIYEARVTAQALSTVNNKVEGVPSPEGSTPVCGAGDCSVTTPVQREIDAVDDALPEVKSSTGSSNAGNAYTNDTLNGLPVNPANITGKVVTPATPINGGTVPVLDTTTGVVSVAPGTPAGDYVITYQICDKLVPDVCDTAKITIRVTAPIIDAKDDGYTANRGSVTDQIVGDAYSENDTLGGVPFTADRITGVVTTPAAPIGGNPAVPVLDVVSGKVIVPPGTPAGEYVINYRICEKLNPNNCDDAIVKVTIKPDDSLLRIVKTAAVRTVKIGDLVRYSLQVENVGAVKVVNANVVDTAAVGFTYVAGSLKSTGLGSAVNASGVRPVQFSGVTLDVGQSGVITYMARVGAGVRSGNHVNRAFARNGEGDSISNTATASVQLGDDPVLDNSLIFGTVFDDRDRDGWQDSASISGLKAKGGFAPDAYIANSTTVDKGQGAEPVADASAPLLRGLALGGIKARESEAAPIDKHTIIIHQKLKSLDFTNDFELTNDQGVTVRMDAAGKTTVQKTGDAKAGRNAVSIEVVRQIIPEGDGFGVNYRVRSIGIDERGIPGVRIASVEGLLMETDQFGRYHLEGMNGGSWEHGRNFILKVDPTTLPGGSEFTTNNPLLRRITPGLPVRFDFGVSLSGKLLAGGRQKIDFELGTVMFAPGETLVQSKYLPVIGKVAARVRQYGGGEILVSANGESEGMAFTRAHAVRVAIARSLPADVLAATEVVVRTQINDANSLISGVTANGAVPGTVLFETDRAAVRPEFQELLAKVAAYMNGHGGGLVTIIGHTDVRASHEYNQRLGQQRAEAVYEALLPHLTNEVRQRIRVELQSEAGTANASSANRKVRRQSTKPASAAPGASGVNPVQPK